MDHPFYDSVRFPFHLPEGDNLFKLLSQVYQGNPQFIPTVYNRCAMNLRPLTLPAAADILWAEALNNLAAAMSIESLCKVLRVDHPLNQQLIAVLDAIEAAKPVSEKRIFSETLFILDCEDQRQAIRKAVADDSPGVLLIKGKSKSGKSHCRHIFKAVAELKKAQVVYLCDGMVVTEMDAIISIFAALGYSDADIPPKVTTEDAWYISVCQRMKQLAVKADEKGDTRKIWIAVDDLGYLDEEKSKPKIATGIRKFFEQFAMFLMDPSFSKYFRLVLIDYGEDNVPTRWREEMWTEVFSAEENIQQKHVEDFLREWMSQKPTQIVEADILSIATGIINATEQPPQQFARYSRLKRLHLILETKISELSRRGV